MSAVSRPVRRVLQRSADACGLGQIRFSSSFQTTLESLMKNTRTPLTTVGSQNFPTVSHLGPKWEAATTPCISYHGQHRTGMSTVSSANEVQSIDDSVPGFQSPRIPGAGNKTTVMFTVGDAAGALNNALGIFAKHGVSMTRVESKPCLRSNDYEFHVDFEGVPTEPKVVALLAELRTQSNQVNILESRKVPWFPRRKRDLDVIANDILDAGAELQADHPGFHDPIYRKRRQQQADIAMAYRYDFFYSFLLDSSSFRSSPPYSIQF